MVYNNISDIKGIFRKFFQKKEDFTASSNAWLLVLMIMVELIVSCIVLKLVVNLDMKTTGYIGFVLFLVRIAQIIYYFAGGADEIDNIKTSGSVPIGGIVLMSLVLAIAGGMWFFFNKDKVDAGLTKAIAMADHAKVAGRAMARRAATAGSAGIEKAKNAAVATAAKINAKVAPRPATSSTSAPTTGTTPLLQNN